MITYILLFLVSIVFLGFSSEKLISLLIRLANIFGFSKEFMGLTFLSIGTSIPEITSHIVASVDILRGGNIGELSDIVVSTNIGSNIVQITLILGIVALFMHVKTTKHFLLRDYIFMLFSILLLYFFSFDGELSRLEGLFLFLIYMIYLYFLYRRRNTLNEEERVLSESNKGKGNSILLIFQSIIFLAILLFSAQLLLFSAQKLVDIIGISGTLLGGVFIGFGTAAPEFVTAISAIRQHSKEMSLGVLVGSNITNPLMAMGLGGMISTYSINKSILFFDLPFWFIVSFIIFFLFKRGYKIYKGEAVIMLLFYLIFLFFKI